MLKMCTCMLNICDVSCCRVVVVFTCERAVWRLAWGRAWGPLFQFGQTALMYAAIAGHAESVRLLLDAGADKNAKDDVRAITTAV